MRLQKKVLLKILSSQQKTIFGIKHQFSDISSIDDFREKVSIKTYDDLLPFIQSQDLHGKKVLNQEAIILYALTSGTTGSSKYIPITQSALEDYKADQHLIASVIHKAYPNAYSGKILAITGKAIEGTMQSGTSFGSMSGLIYKSMPEILQQRYVLSPSTFDEENYEKKYQTIVNEAVSEENISMIATANPSTLLKLSEVINNSVTKWLPLLSPVRQKRIEKLYETNTLVHFNDLWPKLEVISTWMGGNCKVQLPKLKEVAGETIKYVELGYPVNFVVDSRLMY